MYFDLTSFACMRVYGPDCQKFLQSQLSNDISLLEKTNRQSAVVLNKAQLTAYCNPKGRVISLMKICRKNDDEYFIIAPLSLINTIKKRFTIYKLRADVYLSEASEEYQIFAVIDEHGDKNFYSKFKEFGTEAFIFSDSFYNDQGEKYILITRKQHSEKVLTTITQKLQCNKKPESFWLTFEIREGTPWFTSELTETLLPQQINLDLIQAVSFEKGCYPGQEIVARMHYLGKPKRRSFLLVSLNSQLEELTLTNERPISIYSKNVSDEDDIGSLITFANYASHPKKLAFYGLGEFDLGRIASLESNSFFIKSSKGVFELTLGNLPFQNEIIKDHKH